MAYSREWSWSGFSIRGPALTACLRNERHSRSGPPSSKFPTCYGREFCGRPDKHAYELFLQLEDIAHGTTRVKRPQSNGIVERFHRTLLDEHFRVEGRKTWFESVEEMQAVLDAYLDGYNQRRPHQGRGMSGRTPARALRPAVRRRPIDQPVNPEEEGESEARNPASTHHHLTRRPGADCQVITVLVHAERLPPDPVSVKRNILQSRTRAYCVKDV